MAKTPASQEENQLRKRARRRLVGAIALVLVAIVVLPMVLDGEPRQRPENIDIQIPPIPADGPTQGASPPPAALPEASPAPAETPAAPEPAAETPAPPEPVAAGPAPAAPHTAAAESLVIQIGCFADAGKSRALASRIKASKIPAFSERAPGREPTCTRVRAGPFASEAAAQAARKRLAELKLIPPPSEGKIVRRGD